MEIEFIPKTFGTYQSNTKRISIAIWSELTFSDRIFHTWNTANLDRLEALMKIRHMNSHCPMTYYTPLVTVQHKVYNRLIPTNGDYHETSPICDRDISSFVINDQTIYGYMMGDLIPLNLFNCIRDCQKPYADVRFYVPFNVIKIEKQSKLFLEPFVIYDKEKEYNSNFMLPPDIPEVSVLIIAHTPIEQVREMFIKSKT